MKRNIFKPVALAIFITIGHSACVKKLDLLPVNDLTSVQVYKTPEGYKQALAKVYGAFATTGNNGPLDGDIQGIDAGASDFFRLFWYLQELSTDEAVVSWGEPGLPDLHDLNWSATNPFSKGLYYRSMYQITLANDFIRQSADELVTKRGISGEDAAKVKAYRAEARFIRAYQYWVMLDIYANPPFVTEVDELGSILPRQIPRADLFTYIESELKAIDPELPGARQNEYGRADKAAVWALLARLYLNAQVYTGNARYTDAIAYAKKVIDGGYSLTDNYEHLFLADNDQNHNEFILTINYDGIRTQNYGGSTFLTHAPVGGSMSAAQFGIDGGWYGMRTTKSLVNLFPANTNTLFPNNGNPDKRAEFYTIGQSLEISDQRTFTDGYGVTKFRNVKRNGLPGSSPSFADMDMPLFRLSEMYLIYAESVLRNGQGGDLSTAIGYVNKIRTRAYGGSAVGNVTAISEDFILGERARELFWEGFRRTDLIRFNRFTGSDYLWPFKGGVKEGKAVEAFRSIYPIPADDLTANPLLIQNKGY